MEKLDQVRACRHWLCQAAGMGGHRFLKELENTASPESIFELARTGRWEDKIVRQNQ